MSKLKLTITHFKLLDTIKWLNDQGYYASNQGVYKITHGVYDKDTINFTGCPTFSTLVSYGSKKISRLLLPLCRYGYVSKVNYEPTNTLYLRITPKGREVLEQYHKKHLNEYKKKFKKEIPQIVKIEKSTF